MAAGAVLAEPGSAGLSTGGPCAVVVPPPEGGGGVVDPVRRSDGASGRHAGGAGRICRRARCRRRSCRDGAGFTPARCVCRIRSAVACWKGKRSRTRRSYSRCSRPHTRWIMKGKAGPTGGAGSSPDGAGRSTSVHPGLALAVAWRRCGRGGSAGGGMPGGCV